MFASKDTLLTRPSGYSISRSVRLRSSATAYFNRTPASATNRKVWTWSGWVKRGSLGTEQSIFATSSQNFSLFFGTGNDLRVWTNGGNAAIYTSAVYRDPSAWYHIVLQRTSVSPYYNLYVNGVQVTSFAYDNRTTYPSTNDSEVNNTVAHYISGFTGYYLDGYLTEINFIDGQALTPSSFGETDSITGVWKAKKYSGTYGTNGFYLNFSDNSSNTATTIGKDYSGNGNNWTPNNISVTAGVTYDSMTDVPTLTSATAANYCVLNPLNKSSSSTVSNGNLRQTSSGGWYRAYSTIFFASTAVFYAEATMTALNSGANGVRVGIANANSVFTYLGSDANSWSYDNQGNKYNNGTLGAYGASYVQGDVIGILFNNGSLTFYKNGASQGVAYSGLTGTFCFAGSPFDTDIVDWNFGQRPFSNLPSGALALNTYNLPASTITNGAAYMAATTYTGTGSAQNITNSGSFQPDFVWIKNRGGAYGHGLVDSVRGRASVLYSNDTAAQGTSGSTQDVTAFNSNGFALGTNSQIECNASGQSYIGWQWKAGGSSSSNTNGSITSTVSAGATQGFSVATYTGNGSAGATFGHGLGVAPSFVIIKERGNVNGWLCYHISTGNTGYLELDATLAFQTLSTVWNNTTPSSTVVTLGTVSNVNRNGGTFVAYCFAAVAGYSAFGSYTGNGSTDGPFVYTGFRPRWIITKSSTLTTGASVWVIADSSRLGYNADNATLNANETDAENNSQRLDILSNGFKQRTSPTSSNGVGQTYIYMAFAENPFKNALAR